MREVSKDEFYREIFDFDLNVQPSAQGDDYPWINEFRFPNGRVWGKEIPVVGENGRALRYEYYINNSEAV